MNEIFTHVKNLNDYFLDVPFHVAKRGTSHYISILTSTGYKIYDCKKLNVIFQGPLVESPSIINAFKDYVIVYNKKLHFYYRGVSVCENDEEIDDLVVFGIYIVAVNKSKITIKRIEVVNEYEIRLDTLCAIERKDVVKILHPPTYVNKIVIVYRDGLEIYNVRKQKTVHSAKLENCQNGFLTPVLDVIALQCGAKIIFYNLKTDSIEFELGGSDDIKHLSFSTNQPLMLSVNKNDIWMYNLEERRVVKRFEEKVNHATFLFDEDIIAITTKNTIKLVVVEDYKLKLLKIRRSLDEPKFMGISDNKLVLGNEKEVHSIDIHREEQNSVFSIKKYKDGERVYIENSKIIVSNQRCVFRLDQGTKNGTTVIESFKKNIKDVTISTCGNFGALVTQTDKIVIYNLNSKMVYAEDKKEVNVMRAYIDTFENRIMIIYTNRISFCNQKFVESDSIETEKIIDTMLAGNFIAVLYKAMIVFYDINTLKEARVFRLESDALRFSVSNDISLLAVSGKDDLFLYDIKTAKRIEQITTKSECAVFSQNNEFLCILENGAVKCYYNNAFFDSTILMGQENKYMVSSLGKNTEDVRVETFDDLLSCNITDSYRILGPERFNRLVVSNIDKFGLLYSHLTKCCKSNFEESQLALHEIIKLTHKNVTPEVLQNLYDEYMTEYEKYSTEYTKAIAYAKFEELSLE